MKLWSFFSLKRSFSLKVKLRYAQYKGFAFLKESSVFLLKELLTTFNCRISCAPSGLSRAKQVRLINDES